MKLFYIFLKDLIMLTEVYIADIPYYGLCYGLNKCYTSIEMTIPK